MIKNVRATLEVLAEDVLALWQGQAWVNLGHGSWENLCFAEFGDCTLSVSTMGKLREEGMSSAAIAAVSSVPVTTVRKRNLSGGPNGPPDKSRAKTARTTQQNYLPTAQGIVCCV